MGKYVFGVYIVSGVYIVNAQKIDIVLLGLKLMASETEGDFTRVFGLQATCEWPSLLV